MQIILRTKLSKKRKDGSRFFFDENVVTLINKQEKSLATRILGPLPVELRKNKLMKVASLAAGFI